MITPAEIARGSGLETPMGTTTVVVLDIFGENSFELTTREHQDAVETILPHRANPTFGEGVGLGSSNRGEDRRNSHRGEDLGEAFENFVSRLRTKNCMRRPASPRSEQKFRATWVAQGPLGCAVTPRRCTTRRSISMMKST